MDKNSFSEDLVDRVFKSLGYDKYKDIEGTTVPQIDCFACGGKCCIRKVNESVILTPWDIYKLVTNPLLKRSNICTTVDLFNEENNLISYGLSKSSKMPQAIINIRVIEEGDDVGICPFATPICEIKNGKPVPIKGKDGNLVFGCAIHQKKPTICKLYPISRIIQIQEGDEKPIFKYVLVENPFCQQVISGQADLSEFIDKEDEDMSILWFVIAINLVRRFEPAKNQENYYRMYKIGELFYNFDKLLLAAGIPKENLHKERPTFTKIIEMLVNGLSSIEFLLKRKNVFQN